MINIKFRAKSKLSIIELYNMGIPHENGWVYGNLIKDQDFTYITGGFIESTDEYLNHEWWVSVHLETIGQNTGVQDDNDLEVYSGDILRCTNFNDIEYLTTVRYKDGAFIVDVIECDYDYNVLGWALESDIKKCEIIGLEE